MSLPSERELREAIQGVWLEMSRSVGPSRFREYLKGRERACILRSYRELESIWRAYSTSLATPEARTDARKKADRYLALMRVVATLPLPPSVLSYDPTLKGDVGIGDDPIPGVLDPDFFWEEPDSYRALTDPELDARLRASGWTLPPVLRPLAKCGSQTRSKP